MAGRSAHGVPAHCTTLRETDTDMCLNARMLVKADEGWTDQYISAVLSFLEEKSSLPTKAERNGLCQVAAPCAARACSTVMLRPSAHAAAKACSPSWARVAATERS